MDALKLSIHTNLWHPAAHPDDVFLPSPAASFLKITRISSFNNSVIKPILECDNRSSDEEIGKEDNKEHGPNNRRCITCPHKAHGVLLAHHGNDLLLQAGNQVLVLFEVWSEQND